MIKAALLFISLVFAHGEDAPGPHGGHILMPANFHTEVVFDVNETSFRIYLIDIQFKNPVIYNSYVNVKWVQKKKITEISCSSMDDHFLCESPVKMKYGTLSIQAKRAGVTAPIAAKYRLPFKKFEKLPVKVKDHSAHQ